MTHSLKLGSLLLTDTFPDADHDFVLNVLADGMGFGVARGTQEIVTSLLADGDLTRITRYGNREVTFAVEITGPSLGSLAYGEAALRREIGKPNELTWQAPDVLSVPTVFEVITSEMSQSFDDLDELRRRRTFTVTLTCSPHAMSEDFVTVTSLPSGTTTTVVDNCDSAAGWTGTRNGVPTSGEGPTTFFEAGSVQVVEFDASITLPETWTMTRTGAIDFTDTPFLVVEMRTFSYMQGLRVAVTAGGVTLPILESRLLSDGSQYSLVTFDARGLGSVSAVTFTHRSIDGETWQGLFVRKISVSDVAPGVTARQSTRILETVGTERTPASIKVSSPNGATHLGLTIVATAPVDALGHSPDLSRWKVAGNDDSPDTDGFSGTYEPIHPLAFQAQVPTSALPVGGYQLVAALRCSEATSLPVFWSAGTIPPGTSDREVLFEDFTSVTFETANLWQLVPLGDPLSLPTVRTMAGVVQIDILRGDPTNVALPTVELDEAWLFRVDDDCHVSIVNVTSPNLWLDSPTSERPMPTAWMGDDFEARRHPGSRVAAQGNHHLLADGTTLFVATRNVDRPDASATYRPRWHSNAAV